MLIVLLRVAKNQQQQVFDWIVEIMLHAFCSYILLFTLLYYFYYIITYSMLELYIKAKMILMELEKIIKEVFNGIQQAIKKQQFIPVDCRKISKKKNYKKNRFL